MLRRAARGTTLVLRRSSAVQPAAASAASSSASLVPDRPPPPPVGYQNVDGMRHDDGRYKAFKAEVRGILGEERVIDDPVRTFAYGTDASFYRLTPQAVVKVHSEQEVVDVLSVARAHETPVTFRAAGTSLSGQAITDSVLLKLSHNGTAWRRYKIEDAGQKITLEPGLIGGEVNRLLAAYKKKHNCDTQYKIGPDPASIESCMIGGIVANNSSGMCCGVKCVLHPPAPYGTAQAGRLHPPLCAARADQMLRSASVPESGAEQCAPPRSRAARCRPQSRARVAVADPTTILPSLCDPPHPLNGHL